MAVRVHSQIRPSPSRPASRLLACALALLALGTACRKESPPLPPDLLGIYKTSGGSHADHFVEIRPRSVMLGVAGQRLEVIQIERVERAHDEGGNDVYRLHYTADEGYADVLAITDLRSTRGIFVGAGADLWRPSDRR